MRIVDSEASASEWRDGDPSGHTTRRHFSISALPRPLPPAASEAPANGIRTAAAPRDAVIQCTSDRSRSRTNCYTRNALNTQLRDTPTACAFNNGQEK
ncbi:unnamed protein product [Danaus chrysippus]|uniref:(African queen) hypothetical protein n=1 Tax=Danaus chrysippus TaxID=151541 RepID=A0A8J2QCM1_9NEOP|nr:unnamed protein product [Danaus chrysippus]